MESSSYTPANKSYYEKNKEAIMAKEKETKRWISYYERNRETIKQKNLARYHAKHAAANPPAPPPDPAIEEARAKRLAEIIAELHTLLPATIKSPRRKRKTETVTVVDE
jgi:hypothetical protein